MGRKRRNSRRSKNRARARSRAKAAAKKRNTARKAAGRKPSGANKAANRAAARARAQAAAKARNAAKAKAASQKKARTAAAKRAANQAAARKRAQDAAKKRIAAKKAAEAKAAAAKKKAPAKKTTTTKATTTRKDTAKTTRESAFNKQLKKVQAANNVSFGPVRDGATYARNITNYNMKYGATPAIRGKAYEQSLNPNSFKGLSDGMTFGVGPVASADAYARGLNTDNKNVENRLRQVRNLGSTLTGGLISPVRKLTDKEISDRRMRVAARRKANFMGRPTGGKKSHVDPVRTPPLPSELIEETQPTTDIGREQTGTDSNELTRIQNQAYSTTLSNNLAGLAGDFDFSMQPHGSQMSISEAPGLQAGQFRGRRRIRRFNRGRRRGAGDSFRRGGRRIQEFTSTQLNI